MENKQAGKSRQPSTTRHPSVRMLAPLYYHLSEKVYENNSL